MGVFELIYLLGLKAKTAVDIGRAKRLPAKVISVGNITTGGTGKTPAVIAIAQEALKRGYMPCVLTRGYKGRAKGPCFVSKGEGPLMNADMAGDEPVLLAEKLTAVAVVKSASRYEGGLMALRELSPPPDLFILDDGFQHRRLLRDKDIVLVDGLSRISSRLLPVGNLREPLRELRRANIIVLTKTSADSDVGMLEGAIRRHNPAAPLFRSRHRAADIRDSLGMVVPAGDLHGRPGYAFCGIGEPDSFMATLAEAGLDVRGVRIFRDHHRFSPSDVGDVVQKAARAGAEWIITTEKDIIRLKGMPFAMALFSIGVEFDIEGAFFEEVFRGV